MSITIKILFVLIVSILLFVLSSPFIGIKSNLSIILSKNVIWFLISIFDPSTCSINRKFLDILFYILIHIHFQGYQKSDLAVLYYILYLEYNERNSCSDVLSYIVLYPDKEYLENSVLVVITS